MKPIKKKRIKLVYGGFKLAEAFAERQLDPDPELRFTSSRGHMICNSERMSLGRDLDQLPVAQWRGNLLLVWEQCLPLEEHYNELLRSKIATDVIQCARSKSLGDSHWNSPDPDFLFRVPLFHYDMDETEVRDAILRAAKANYRKLCRGLSRRQYACSVQYCWNNATDLFNSAAKWSGMHGISFPDPSDIPEDYHGQIAAASFRFKASNNPNNHYLDITPLHPCYTSTFSPITAVAA